jgi:uncharacterized protein
VFGGSVIQWFWLTGHDDVSDCACATETASLSDAVPTGVLWQTPPSLYRAPLPDDYELLFNPAGTGAIATLNEAARQRFARFDRPRPLVTGMDQQLAALRLLTPDCGAVEPPQTVSQTLTAWLHVTDACNLRCPYCYVRDRGREMDGTTGRAAVEAVVRSAEIHGFRSVKLKYAGGEPTLRWPLVRALHAYARTLAERAGLKLRATVLSNGTHSTNAMVDWFLDQNVRLMISLDGIGPVHNAQRPFADGRGSFTQVAHTIDQAVACGLSPYLSVTVTDQNVEHLADAVAFALARDLRFNLNFVRDVRSTSRLAVPSVQQRWIEGLTNALSVIEAELPRDRILDGLLDRSLLSAPHAYPCGAGRNYVVIGPHGTVARCQMAMDQSVTDVGEADPLMTVQKADHSFYNIAVDERSQCRECAWRYVCAGGCPILAKSVDGTLVPSPYCKIYRALFPQLLRLEGLRLLKWKT